MPDFSIKVDNLLPTLKGTLVDENGVKIDLTNATAVKLLMINPGDTGAPKVDSAAGFLAPKTDGRVEYIWQGTDTDTEGDFDGEFEVTFPGGPTSFPNHRYMEIKIKAKIETVT